MITVMSKSLIVILKFVTNDPLQQESMQHSTDADLLRHLIAFGASILSVQRTLDTHVESVTKTNRMYGEKFEKLDATLESLKSLINVAKVSEDSKAANASKAGDDDQDRKRIKERLKEAFETHKKREHRDEEVVKWPEYLFGICEPDKRQGKKVSRLASCPILFI